MNRSAWRRSLKLWVPALALCLVNLVFLAAYRLVLAEEAEIGRGLLDRREAELETLRSVRRDLEALQAEAIATREGIGTFYDQHLSTEEQKLTAVIAEIKDLASRAGLSPGSIRYDRESISRQGAVERTLVFEVRGSYPDLRRLVNLIEVSESFLVLKEVSLRVADESGERLGIELQIAVLFAARNADDGRTEA